MLSVYKLSDMCYPNLSQCCAIHTFESSITITISYTVFCIYMWGHCGLIKFTCMITFEATCLKTRSILKPNHGRTTICYKWGLTSVHTWYCCARLYFNLIRHIAVSIQGSCSHWELKKWIGCFLDATCKSVISYLVICKQFLTALWPVWGPKMFNSSSIIPHVYQTVMCPVQYSSTYHTPNIDLFCSIDEHTTYQPLICFSNHLEV